MSDKSLHAGELVIDIALANALISTQYPQWAKLEIRPILSSGTDNEIFRLGENMCLRIPKSTSTINNLDKEYAWLPYLTPLPLRIPAPIAKGKPGNGYPCNWCIFDWIDGETATPNQLHNQHDVAVDIAEFIKALQIVDTRNAPLSGSHNNYRGVPLINRDLLTRKAIGNLRNIYDPSILTVIWETALNTTAWDQKPVWLHGDIHSGNLLFNNHRLCAVIDFGLSGVGDPACDLMVGWTQFSPDVRETFQKSINADTATLARGKGWALSWAVIALAHYLDTNPFLTTMSKGTIKRILES